MKKQKQDLSAKEKIIKIAKIGEVVAKVLYILAIVCTVTAAVCAVVLPFVKTKGMDLTPAEIAISLGVAALYAFMLINIWWNVEQIFKNMRLQQTPFNTRVTHYLKKTALGVIIISIVPALIGSTLMFALAPHSEFNLDFQYVGLGVGVLLLILGYVFNYGIELQKKEDETL